MSGQRRNKYTIQLQAVLQLVSNHLKKRMENKDIEVVLLRNNYKLQPLSHVSLGLGNFFCTCKEFFDLNLNLKDNLNKSE